VYFVWIGVQNMIMFCVLHVLFFHKPASKSLLISPCSGNTEMAFLNGMKDLLPIGCQLLQTIAG
jgi:hypothetical protein